MSHAHSRSACLASQRQAVRATNGKVIGQIEGDTFTKRVVGSKHRLNKPPAWAIDAQTFDEQVRPHASVFRVHDTESDTVYEVSVDYFDEHKGVLSQGFGLQYFLVLSKWEVVKRNGNGCRQLAFAFEVGAVA